MSLVSNSHKVIDTHCHPQFPQYDADRDAVMRRALDAGVGMICVGTDPETSRQAIALAEKFEGVWASVGIHPNDVGTFRDVGEIMKLSDHPKVVAIGEVGLDYYRTKDPEAQKFQRDVLRDFLHTNKPLIIHCREAHDDLLSILQATSYKLHPTGVIHSFTGSPHLASQYIERGWYIGVNGIVTFSSEYEAMVRSLPADRFLLETDAPYLAPASHRGKRNEPVYILETAERVGDIRGENTETVLARSLNNTRALLMNVL